MTTQQKIEQTGVKHNKSNQIKSAMLHLIVANRSLVVVYDEYSSLLKAASVCLIIPLHIHKRLIRYNQLQREQRKILQEMIRQQGIF
jgi:hypothetical protein